MNDSIDFIDVELYTERLNDMYARIAEFVAAYPGNKLVPKLKEQQQTLAIAHHKSRFYRDKEHFAIWDDLLQQSERLLTEAQAANTL